MQPNDQRKNEAPGKTPSRYALWYSFEYAKQNKKRKIFQVDVFVDGAERPFLSIVAPSKRDAAPVAHQAVRAYADEMRRDHGRADAN